MTGAVPECISGIMAELMESVKGIIGADDPCDMTGTGAVTGYERHFRSDLREGGEAGDRPVTAACMEQPPGTTDGITFSMCLPGLLAGLLLSGCLPSSTVQMVKPGDGDIRECPRGSSTWQQEAIREQHACMKAYEEAGYVRLEESGSGVRRTSAPLTTADHPGMQSSAAEDLPAATGTASVTVGEAQLVDRLRQARDAYKQGSITEAEYRRLCDEIIQQL